jgi:PHD/YefM family antitoxin component YafN of YafNO toxin-antitoxin module
MSKFEPLYIINNQGKRTGVILDIAQYEMLLAELEVLADLRAYDEAKSSDPEVIPFEQAIREIEGRD